MCIGCEIWYKISLETFLRIFTVSQLKALRAKNEKREQRPKFFSSFGE